MSIQANIVSFDDEPLILVNENDEIIGHESKLDAHRGPGVLHRAFSIFLVNDQAEVLLQQRSATKPLWPGYWSNTCCSHPRRGETYEAATQRRLLEELSLSCDLNFLYKFTYHAQYNEMGAEHELCAVYLGHVSGRPEPAYNPTEIADTAWVSINTVSEWLSDPDRPTTPWFAMEWHTLTTEHERQLLNSDLN